MWGQVMGEEARSVEERKKGSHHRGAGATQGTRGKRTPLLDDICQGLGGGTVESATAPSAGVDRALLSLSKFLLSRKRRLIVQPLTSSGLQRLERGSRNAYPDP